MGLFDFFKSKKEEDKNERKVYKSEEVNRPGFQRYFEDAKEAECFDWNEQGILARDEELITYGTYNYRMNRAACHFAGKEKCEEVAKRKGWKADFFNDIAGWMVDKKGDLIDWYILHDALS